MLEDVDLPESLWRWYNLWCLGRR